MLFNMWKVVKCNARKYENEMHSFGINAVAGTEGTGI